jgi:hypothetical protein
MQRKMDFDIGTIIYIIITIVAIAAGAFGKKKKPAPSSPVSEDENEPVGFFEKLEEQFSGIISEAKESVQNITTEFIPVEEKPIAEPTFQDEYKALGSLLDQYNFDHTVKVEESFFDSEESEELLLESDDEQIQDLISSEAIRTTDGQVLEVIETDTTTYPDYLENIQDFDLGTGIIYSIIINRKEY